MHTRFAAQVFAVSDGTEKSSASVDASGIPAGALTKLHEGPTPGSVVGFAWVPGSVLPVEARGCGRSCEAGKIRPPEFARLCTSNAPYVAWGGPAWPEGTGWTAWGSSNPRHLPTMADESNVFVVQARRPPHQVIQVGRRCAVDNLFGFLDEMVCEPEHQLMACRLQEHGMHGLQPPAPFAGVVLRCAERESFACPRGYMLAFAWHHAHIHTHAHIRTHTFTHTHTHTHHLHTYHTQHNTHNTDTHVFTHVARRGSQVIRFAASEGAAESPATLSAPQPLSGVSAIGAQGLAVLTADAQSICFSVWPGILEAQSAFVLVESQICRLSIPKQATGFRRWAARMGH
eukprot:1158433-Pelagomonas_calceolata.AAC.6